MRNRQESFRAPPHPGHVQQHDGILLVDKPSGPTSHDVVDAVRGSFPFRKVGHGGTLDPQATGLLIMLLGRATKLSSHFIGSDKEYEGTIRLGIATDSQDAQGLVVGEADCSGVGREQIEAAMAELTGDIYQLPPMVSATKVGGVPLYKRARKGQVVERQPKLIHVYEFRLTGFDLPRATFVVRCSKGTYARTLCADIGDALGCGAHLEQLRRTRCGEFVVEDAMDLKDLLALERDEMVSRIVPLRDVVARTGAERSRRR